MTTDNAFPYRVCGGQQESGSVCVASRGDDGQITFRDWHPVGVEEYGYVAPDPLEPRHRLRRQGDALRPAHRRGAGAWPRAVPRRGLPRRAHRADPVLARRPRTLYFASNILWKTTTAARPGSRSAPT